MNSLIRRWAKWIFSFGATFGLTACGKPVSNDMLPGDYLAVYSYGVEELVLHGDGFYEQLFSSNDQPVKIAINRGTWSFKAATQQVILQDPVNVDDGFGRLSSLKRHAGAYRPHKATMTSQGVRLGLNDDLGVAYKRKK